MTRVRRYLYIAAGVGHGTSERHFPDYNSIKMFSMGIMINDAAKCTSHPIQFLSLSLTVLVDHWPRVHHRNVNTLVDRAVMVKNKEMAMCPPFSFNSW